MKTEIPLVLEKNKNFIFFLSLSLLWMILLYFFDFKFDMSLWDEGFLWYGTQRVFLSEAPMRDFMSYDPGRYYFISLIMQLVGNSSFYSFRFAIYILHFIGIVLTYFLIPSVARSKKILFLLVFIVVCWMNPRHKIFDITVSLASILMLKTFLLRPLKRCFFVGFFSSILLICGKNHFVYFLPSLFLSLIFLRFFLRERQVFLARSFFDFFLGFLTGLLPLIFLSFLKEGFLYAYIESFIQIIGLGETNLSRPIPTPWSLNWNYLSRQDFFQKSHFFLVSLFYISLPFFSLFLFGFLIKKARSMKREESSLLFSSFLISFFYLHHAYSRADFPHLSQSVIPLILGLLFFIETNSMIKRKLIYVVSICVISFLTVVSVKPFYQCLIYKNCQKVQISGSEIEVPLSVAEDVNLLYELDSKYGKEGKGLFLPFMPGAYAVLNQKIPVWAFYALWPRSDDFQRREIQRIKESNVAYVLLSKGKITTKAGYFFIKDNKLIYEYIINNFVLSSIENDKYYLYLRK